MDGNLLLTIILLGSLCPTTKAIMFGYEVDAITYYPYHVLVVHVKSGVYCSGGILNDRHVITSARCILKRAGLYNPEDGEVIAGTLFRKKWTPTQRTRDIVMIHIHPDYKNKPESDITRNLHDLAMLQIVSLGQFDRNVNKIDLSSSGPAADWECYFAGWGGNNLKLNYVIQKTWSDAWCRYRYGTKGRFFGNWMHCAQHPVDRTRRPQAGDEGGLLKCGSLAYGVFTFRDENFARNLPIVYTDTSRYLDWIRSFTPTPTLPPTTTTTTTTTTTLRTVQNLIAAKSDCYESCTTSLYVIACLFLVIIF